MCEAAWDTVGETLASVKLLMRVTLDEAPLFCELAHALELFWVAHLWEFGLDEDHCELDLVSLDSGHLDSDH